MREYFYQIADFLAAQLSGREVYLCNLHGEESDFVRFNRSRVRQAGNVVQSTLSLDLIEGRRHAAGDVTLSGDLDADRARLVRFIHHLREQRAVAPEDPHLLYSTEVRSTERIHSNQLPDAAAVIPDIQRAGAGYDLVGIFASGAMHVGFANSLGQRNWYTNYSYNFDWSYYHDADQAAKAGYAGFQWQSAEFERKVAMAREQLAVVSRRPRELRPGRYRVYLAPAALYDIIGMLGWGGFSARAHRTKATPLLRMVEEGATLHPAVTIAENTREGIAPDFQEAGFIRPDRVTLIEGGRYRECLVSPRTGAEYGVPTNGASAAEAPESTDVAAGSVGVDSVLSTLHTGLYVSNLWYLNFSDRTACRTTGMTRFATFWVENGVIQEPVKVMRFDESLYRMLGENLIGLTAEREIILDTDTYYRRSTQSARLPGALIDEFTFTL